MYSRASSSPSRRSRRSRAYWWRCAGAAVGFFRGMFGTKLQELECGVPRSTTPTSSTPTTRRGAAAGHRPAGAGAEMAGETWPEQPARVALNGSDGFLLLPLTKEFLRAAGHFGAARLASMSSRSSPTSARCWRRPRWCARSAQRTRRRVSPNLRSAAGPESTPGRFPPGESREAGSQIAREAQKDSRRRDCSQRLPVRSGHGRGSNFRKDVAPCRP